MVGAARLLLGGIQLIRKLFGSGLFAPEARKEGSQGQARSARPLGWGGGERCAHQRCAKDFNQNGDPGAARPDGRLHLATFCSRLRRDQFRSETRRSQAAP